MKNKMKCRDAMFTLSGEHDKIWQSLLYEKPVRIKSVFGKLARCIHYANGHIHYGGK